MAKENQEETTSQKKDGSEESEKDSISSETDVDGIEDVDKLRKVAKSALVQKGKKSDKLEKAQDKLEKFESEQSDESSSEKKEELDKEDFDEQEWREKIELKSEGYSPEDIEDAKLIKRGQELDSLQKAMETDRFETLKSKRKEKSEADKGTPEPSQRSAMSDVNVGGKDLGELEDLEGEERKKFVHDNYNEIVSKILKESMQRRPDRS